jgi:hypothetical protein
LTPDFNYPAMHEWTKQGRSETCGAVTVRPALVRRKWPPYGATVAILLTVIAIPDRQNDKREPSGGGCMKTISINRAPVLTLWAPVVAVRFTFKGEHGHRDEETVERVWTEIRRQR